jgi:DNA-binding transcriptional MerR regulator/methylmalonyl-CoA mutase cobalamin-binding subunit
MKRQLLNNAAPQARGKSIFNMSEFLHNIKAVSMRTGLSAHVIRIWEKRYGAVTPARTDSQRRLYAETDVERLTLMGRLTQRGFAIRNVATLNLGTLQQLLAQGDGSTPKPKSKLTSEDEQDFITRAVEATRNFDSHALEQVLDHAMLQLGVSGVLERMLIRLLQRIGELWAKGELTASMEHFASAALRDYLAQRVQSMHLPASAPRLVVGTPMGQLHEMGAVISAALARKAGWQVTYLGPSLPAEELIHACLRNQAQVLVLSIIYPLDDLALREDLQRLSKQLPDSLKIVVGGPNLRFYEETLARMNAQVITDFTAFTPALRELREGA